MPMTSAGRATAIYNQIAASANFSKLSAAEQSALQAQIQLIWGTGDLTYIQGNALVNTNDTGTVTSGPGSGGAVIATGIGTVT
jgi:hypothetical protein